MKNIKDLLSLGLKQKRNLGGFLFTLPFLVGFFLFFLYPLIQSIIFSLSRLSFEREGVIVNFVGLENFREVIFVHPEFHPSLVETVSQTLIDIPAILAFSFFASILLNQKFRGRTIARVIFFLPVILSAGVVLRIEQNDYMTALMGTMGEEAESMFGLQILYDFFMDMRLPEHFLEFIMISVNHLPDIIRSSGIQIFIFLAGLQSIPGSLYEAANIEGASGWENFWLITFPLMTPIILLNLIFTIISSFTAVDNELLELIERTSFGGGGYGLGIAMSLLYFLFIGVFLFLVYKVFSARVFYQE